jgi:hypothetical protein
MQPTFTFIFAPLSVRAFHFCTDYLRRFAKVLSNGAAANGMHIAELRFVSGANAFERVAWKDCRRASARRAPRSITRTVEDAHTGPTRYGTFKLAPSNQCVT